MATIYWLIAFVVFVGIEAMTMALTTIWFAGGAFIAFLLSLFRVGVEIQLVVFVVASFLLLFLTRPFANRYINSHTVKTNAESLIGKEAKVTADISGTMEPGTAVVNGQEWTAKAAVDSESYPKDSVVVIKEIQGVTLIVGKKQEEV